LSKATAKRMRPKGAILHPFYTQIPLILNLN